MSKLASNLMKVLAAAVLLVLAAAPLAALEPAADDPALQPAELMPRASRAQLFDIVGAEGRAFAVGQHGIVLRRDTDGRWQQRPTPTRAALTAIAAAEGQLWAVGHSGVILHSADGGESWMRQRVEVWDPYSDEPSHGAPLLDVLMLDGRAGFAVGAFSKILRTSDGGTHWERLALSAAEPQTAAPGEDRFAVYDAAGVLDPDLLVLGAEADPHLNAIARDAAGSLYLAGERGAMFRSDDLGQTWQRLVFPYEGSMFGILAWGAGHVLAFGLRGHVFESTDGGASWSQLDTGTEVALMGGVARPGGGVVIVGNEGVILERRDAASPLTRRIHQNALGETPVLSGVLPADAGGLLLIGEKGVDTDVQG